MIGEKQGNDQSCTLTKPQRLRMNHGISSNCLRRDTLSSDAFQRKHRALMYSEDEMRLLGFMDIARRNGTVESEGRVEKMSRKHKLSKEFSSGKS